MIIFIDASRALHRQPTGIEVYSFQIIDHLLKLKEASSHDWRLLAPAHPPQNHQLVDLPAQARWEIIPGQWLWTRFSLSRAFATRPDWRDSVLFVPGHVLPLITPQASVITIHDLAYRLYPQAYGRLKAFWIDQEIGRSVRKANQIIVPTQATATDLVRAYRAPEEKVTVIPHGADHLQFEANSRPSRRPYLLAIGRLEERKNTDRLIRAFADLKERTAYPHQLILVGQPGYGWPKIKGSLSNLKPSIRSSIRLTGHLKPKETIRWLAHAEALVYPSLYEGFGLPALEAMLAKVPVVAARTPAVEEVGADAVLYVDPLSIRAISQGLEQIMTNHQLRDSLIAKGAKRVKDFTWQKTAQKTLEVLLNSHNRNL